MTEPPDNLLEIRGLSVSFPDKSGRRTRAVDRVSLEIRPGRTTAVVGESGSGKSVTALSILRLLDTPPARYDSGSIHFIRRDGTTADLLALPDDQIRDIRGDQIAMIFQEPMTSLNPVINIGEQIIEAVRLHRNVSKKQARDIAIQALDEVGIPDPASRLKAYPHEFSGGMRQRVMIAIALTCEPRLLIADEPTTALDVTIQAQILELIRRLKQEHRLGVMLITHDLGLVATHADSIVVMYAGRVVESGAARAILDSPHHPYTRGLLASVPDLGDDRPRLRTLEAFTKDDEQFNFTHRDTPYRSWWPGDRSHTSHDLLALDSNHLIRVWAEPPV